MPPRTPRSGRPKAVTGRTRARTPILELDPGPLIDELRLRRTRLAEQKALFVAARRAFALSTGEYAQLFELGALPCFILDGDGIIQRSNLTGGHLLDCEPIRLVNVPLLSYVIEPDRGALLDHVRRCRHSDDVVSTEMVMHSRRGIEIPIELASRVFSAQHDGTRLYHTTALDLRERRRLETERWRAAEERRRAEQKARSEHLANEAKDRFLAMLSHELRTPLTPIVTTATMWKDDASLPQPVRDALAMIHRNATVEGRLIDDLLDLTRITQNKLVLRNETVDVEATVADVARFLEPEVAAAGLTLTLHLDHVHPVSGDATRLSQVVWNLLRNAIRFTPRGGVIDLATSAASADTIRLTVTDTGIGFDAAASDRLFEPYAQHDETHGGLGLGLTIVAGIVRAHGGTIAAFSDGPGRGARFIVELPARAAELTAAPPVPMAPATLSPLTILLVEDHTDTAVALSYLLEKRGYVVECASSVAAALAIVKTSHVDVLVSDLRLPDGSGLDLMRALRPRRSLRSIALTGFGRREDIAKTRAAGFDCHLTKPVDATELIDAIERLRHNDA